MCGIQGFFSASNSPISISETQFSSFMRNMDYRGPDAHSVYTSPQKNVILGHLRLSIHDLSESGNQPMHLNTADGLFTIVFNGEVYNFTEIKKQLVGLGYNFVGGSDTEVVLAAFAAWRTDCVHKFNGMFSIAVYSHAQKELFLARDRLGKKPLYYYLAEDGSIAFSSELKSLVPLVSSIYPSFLNDQSLDPDLIDSYFTLGYIPGEKTLYNGIKRLLPGHMLTASSQSLKKDSLSSVKIERYWSLNFVKKANADRPDAEFIKESKALFEDSLTLRLRSDVQVGVFLSGGLDSSVVVAGLAAKGIRLNTYSVKFDASQFGSHYDEGKYAKEVSERFHTKHTDVTMTPTMFKDLIPKYISLMDEPVTEAAALSLYLVSKLASKDVKVVLSGEGSDELFAGYELYRRMQTLEKMRLALTPFGAKALSLLSYALPAGNKVKKYLKMLGQPFEERYRGISVYPQEYRDALYKKSFSETIPSKENSEINSFYRSIFTKTKGLPLLSRMLHFDTHTWLVDDLLIKADRMSMANSQELRCPFLDYRLAELAAKYPDSVKIRKGDPKWLVKQWYKKTIPDAITNREKVGFPTPLKMMFSGPLKEYVFDSLLSEGAQIYRFLSFEAVEKLVNEHFENKHDHHTVLWQLIVIEEYLQQRSALLNSLKEHVSLRGAA